jgi:hypothetical protein
VRVAARRVLVANVCGEELDDAHEARTIAACKCSNRPVRVRRGGS